MKCPNCESTKRPVTNSFLCEPCYHEVMIEAFLKEGGGGPEKWEAYVNSRKDEQLEALKSLVRKVREAQKIESYVQGIWTRDATEAGQNAIQLEAELDEMVKE